MRRSVDVAVVGAGPAGIGAALTAVRNGASVAIIDENDMLGGHLRWTMARLDGFDGELDGLRGHEIAAWANGALSASGVEMLTSTVAWGLFEENTLGVASPESSFQLYAGQVILATGAVDLTWPFPGWELPGVITATAALRFMHLDRIMPGHRVVVVGDGSLAATVAADVGACGGNVVHRQPTVNEFSVGGSDSVEWFAVGDRREPSDCIVLALGKQPDAQLALQAQVAIRFAAAEGGFVVARNESFETSVGSVYVVGGAGGLTTPSRAFAEGVVAGEAASDGAGLKLALNRLRAIEQHAEPLPPMPPIADDTIVCRCEEVAATTVRRAIADGAISLNDLKRRTRSGMGICQGIYCNRAMAGMIAAEAGIPIDTVGPMTARPPARLIPMAAMADAEA